MASPPSEILYGALALQAEKVPKIRDRFDEHVLARTGMATLAEFHHNGAVEAEKVALYHELAKALVLPPEGDPRGLDSLARVTRDTLATAAAQPKPEPTPDSHEPDALKLIREGFKALANFKPSIDGGTAAHPARA